VDNDGFIDGKWHSVKMITHTDEYTKKTTTKFIIDNKELFDNLAKE
jgi:hypothetical protein